MKEGSMRTKRSILIVAFSALSILTAPLWAPRVDAEPRYPGAEIVEKADFSNITSDATTLVKSGAGSLACITVNGGTMGAITVYDSLTAAGTKIGTVASPVAGMVLPYGVRFKTGLTIVTADNTNLTVSYY